MEAYSIAYDNGTLVLQKLGKSATERKGRFMTKNDRFINPVITIYDGLLHIKGERLSYAYCSKRGKSDWDEDKPFPVTIDHSELIYYSEDDVFEGDIITKKGIWPFRRKNIQKDVKHLPVGHYLLKKGTYEEITTTNFRIIK